MEQSLPLPRLVALSNNQRKFGDRPIYRAKNRNGQRQLIFLPALVLKFARGQNHQALLQEEAQANRLACVHPFWRDLAAPALRLGRFGILRQRYRAVQLEEFDAVAAIVEDRLHAALAYPRRTMLADLTSRGLFASLSHDRRVRLAAVLFQEQVPATSMHGDLHFFNFVAKRGDYRLLDWEHFEADGSFVFDYLEFHISVTCFNSGNRWAEVLAGIGPDHPAVRALAARLGADAAALLAYYLFIKIDTIFRRKGGAAPADNLEDEALLTILGRAIDRLRPDLSAPVSLSA